MIFLRGGDQGSWEAEGLERAVQAYPRLCRVEMVGLFGPVQVAGNGRGRE